MAQNVVPVCALRQPSEPSGLAGGDIGLFQEAESVIVKDVGECAQRPKPGRRERTERRRRRLGVRRHPGQGAIDVGDVPVGCDSHQQRKIVDRSVLQAQPSSTDQCLSAEGGGGEAHRRSRPDAALDELRAGFKRDRILGGRRATRRREGLAVHVDDVVGGVHEPNGRPAREDVDGNRQVIGVELVIVAQQHDEVGLGQLDQPIGVRGPADVVLERSIDEAWIAKRGDDLGGVVIRGVVRYHQGQVAIALREHARDRPAQKAGSVAGGNADGDVSFGVGSCGRAHGGCHTAG